MGTPGLQECKYMRNSCSHFTSGVLNLPPQTLPYNSALLEGQVETSDIVDFSTLTFSHPAFRIFPYARSERSDSEKSGIFKHLTFQVMNFADAKYEKSDLKSRRFSNSQSRCSHAFCSDCCDS